METVMYVLPLLFALIAIISTRFMPEFYAFSGVTAVWVSFTLMTEANPLSEMTVMLALTYLFLGLAMLLRIVTISTGGEER